jgi:hypothetical protein
MKTRMSLREIPFKMVYTLSPPDASRLSRMLKKAKNRWLTRAAQKRGHVFAGAYRAATVRGRGTWIRDRTSETVCLVPRAGPDFVQ